EQQRTETDPPAFRIREAADYELLLFPAFDFQPVARASQHVQAIRAFCDHALQTFAASLPKIRFTRTFPMIGKAHRNVKLKCLFQQSLAVDQGNLSQVVAVQVQQIEKKIKDLDTGTPRCIGIAQVHSALQLRKAGDITLERNDFAVGDV